MFPASTALARRSVLAISAAGVFGLVLLAVGTRQALPSAEAQEPVSLAPAGSTGAQARAPIGAIPTARAVLGPAAVVPLAQEPPAKLVVDPPLPDELVNGVAIIQFRTENARILAVYGPAAVAVSPRVGHLHVTVDDAPWHWAHSSTEPVIVAPLPAGPHKILIELADGNHTVLASEVVQFDVPRR
jgi:hypothetical protein